jgi:HK97 family phage prohead protease
MINKSIPAEITKSVDGSYRFIMSSVAKDRTNDTIDEKAYAPNLGKRFPALFNHDANKIVGTWENLNVKSGKLIGDLKIATSTGLGKMIKALLDDGVPLGASVGFRGKGAPNDFGGTAFSEVELLETSIVSIPCNSQAMQIAKSFSADVQSSDIDALMVKSDQPTGADGIIIEDVLANSRKAILKANKTLRNK